MRLFTPGMAVGVISSASPTVPPGNNVTITEASLGPVSIRDQITIPVTTLVNDSSGNTSAVLLLLDKSL
jgi:hypothetical protein